MENAAYLQRVQSQSLRMVKSEKLYAVQLYFSPQTMVAYVVCLQPYPHHFLSRLLFATPHEEIMASKTQPEGQHVNVESNENGR